MSQAGHHAGSNFQGSKYGDGGVVKYFFKNQYFFFKKKVGKIRQLNQYFFNLNHLNKDTIKWHHLFFTSVDPKMIMFISSI
jgi:hypothetical protein